MYEIELQFWSRVFSNQYIISELQKREDRADQSVLFFLDGANFWEKHAKNRRKHAKNRRKQAKTRENRRFFGANFFGGKIGRC